MANLLKGRRLVSCLHALTDDVEVKDVSGRRDIHLDRTPTNHDH
jgi:hypothetical protein